MDQAEAPPAASPLNGVVPPPEHRFPPGQSGNPAGRPTAGASVREWLNVLADKDLSEDEIRAIARDKKASWTKRTAAERMLRTLEAGDIADFAGLLSGENRLEDLRGMGINTEVVKKFKQKTRKVSVGNGETEEVIEREIELHDRAGDDFDRICDRTEGRPKQEITQHVDGTIRTPAEGADQAAIILDRIRGRVSPGSGGTT